MDRRQLLKTALAAPVVAAVPVATSIEAPAIPLTAPGPTPANLKPYADYIFEWFVSHDGETYYEAFPTKKDAEEYARLCDYSIIAECRPQDFDLTVNAGRVIEDIDENNYERIGDGDGIGVRCTDEQEADLGMMLTRAMEAWVVKHNIDIRAWSFGDVRDEVRVDMFPHLSND